MARDYATLKNSPLSRVKGQHSKLLVTFPNGSAVVGTRSKPPPNSVFLYEKSASTGNCASAFST